MVLIVGNNLITSIVQPSAILVHKVYLGGEKKYSLYAAQVPFCLFTT